jgi:hypothetical protein
MKLRDIFEGDIIKFPEKDKISKKIDTSDYNHNDFKQSEELLKKLVKSPSTVNRTGLNSVPKIKAMKRFTDSAILDAIEKYHPRVYDIIKQEQQIYHNKYKTTGYKIFDPTIMSRMNSGEQVINMGLPGTYLVLALGKGRPDKELQQDKKYQAERTQLTHAIHSSILNALKDIFGYYADYVEIGGGLGSRIFIGLSKEYFKELSV